jgi:hypothetical protein
MQVLVARCVDSRLTTYARPVADKMTLVFWPVATPLSCAGDALAVLRLVWGPEWGQQLKLLIVSAAKLAAAERVMLAIAAVTPKQGLLISSPSSCCIVICAVAVNRAAAAAGSKSFCHIATAGADGWMLWATSVLLMPRRRACSWALGVRQMRGAALCASIMGSLSRTGQATTQNACTGLQCLLHRR